MGGRSGRKVQRSMRFEQTFKNIDDALWKEAGCGTELDYTEQTSWSLFLKHLDDLEQERAMAAELVGKPYDYLLDDAHRWSRWAVPKTADGTVDHDTAVTGDDLIAFVNTDLFLYLKGFTDRASDPDTIEYKIGALFSEIENKFRSGYSLRDALELVDGLHYRSQEEKHELSHLYEAKIRNMGNAGRNGGEYYTPRPSFAPWCRSRLRDWARRLGTRPVGPPVFCASPTTICVTARRHSRPHNSRACRRPPSTARKRSRWRTSSGS